MKKYNLKRTVTCGVIVASLISMTGCSQKFETESKDYSVYDNDGNLKARRLSDPFYLEYGDNKDGYFLEATLDGVKYLVDNNIIGHILAKGYQEAYFDGDNFVIQYESGYKEIYTQGLTDSLKR